MIILLGASGYVGSEFERQLYSSAVPFRSISRRDIDYTQRDVLIELIRSSKASFLINAAGYTGKPNVDACEFNKSDCLFGNAVLPGVIREACEACDLPWGHVSSGCIYTGSRADGSGFTEDDSPNFCFRTNNCSFYSGCKALGEECLAGDENVFIWRLRIPFSNVDSSRNYLSKLMRYEQLLDATNSVSHLGDFVRASLECWMRRVDFGIYNITNTGSITTRRVTQLLCKYLVPEKKFHYFEDEEHFMRLAAKAPRSNCVMDNCKLTATGISISGVEEAIERSLKEWKSGILI